MSKSKCRCGAVKATKVSEWEPKLHTDLLMQKVRCDNCNQMRMNYKKPRKAKENNDGPDSNNLKCDS
jgi:hypothetical protein